MVYLNGVSVIYGERWLLDNATLQLKNREKIGLVGRNGVGKSTLLKIIAREITPVQGSVNIDSGVSFGVLNQDLPVEMESTVSEAVISSVVELTELNEAIAAIELQMPTADLHSPEGEKLFDTYSHLTERLGFLSPEVIKAESEKILKGLGFKQEELDQPVKEFSGGWQMRVQLAKLLVQHHDLLLLDEPTNHLDIESIIWLEDFIRQYSGCIVIVSHDKTFLDNTTNRTIEIESGKVYEYKAGYSKFLILRDERRTKLEATYQNQQKAIQEKEKTINRFMAKATKTSMAQSMQKQLNKMERIELDEVDSSVMRISFQPSPRSGEVVAEMDHVNKNYGPKHVLENVNLKIIRGERIAFVGQNGQGKSTLIKILAKQHDATSGDFQLGYNVAMGYYAQNQADEMDPSLTVLQTLEFQCPPEMRTRLRSILGAFLFRDEDVDKKISVLSGGERARVALAAMMLRPINLLILDEPTNHLDMLSKDVLKNAIMQYDGTLVVVSHDRDFLAGLTSKVYELHDHVIDSYLGDINYFLDKRDYNHLRELDTKGKKSEKKLEVNTVIPISRNDGLNPDQIKKFKKELDLCEKRIFEIEVKCKSLEEIMSEEGFYERADMNKLLSEYENEKSLLKETNIKWEQLATQLDEIQA